MASSADALRGRTALVTGGSRGIGRATAAALVAAGVRTVIAARDAATLAEAGAAIGAGTIQADVTDAGDVERLVSETGAQLGRVPDILVNAAGAFAIAAVEETTAAELQAAVSANLIAPFLLARSFLAAMKERGSGHIVTIGSIAGRAAFPGNGAYSASKFGIRGLHAVLDAELRGTGVRTTLVEPAATDTGLWDSIDLASNPGLPDRAVMLRPEAVADAVLFALSRAPDVAIRNIILERS